MPDIQFNQNGQYIMPSKCDGDVCLLKTTWESHIASKSERGYLKFNFHKVATTLIDPDQVNESLSIGKNAHLYWKEFSRWKMSEQSEMPTLAYMKYFVVIVDTRSKLISTIYEGGRVKAGKKVWPEAQK